MTKFKWINRWISAELSGLHMLAAIACILLYSAGYLLPDQGFMKAGYSGFFILVIMYLLHLQLHSCDRFLSMHPAADQIPKAQMKQVNGIYMTVFLTISGAVMVLFKNLNLSRILEGLKALLASFFRLLARLFPEGRIVPIESEAPAALMPSVLGEGPPANSLLTKVLDLIFAVIAVAALIFLAVFLLCQLFLLLQRIFKPREDGDEKEFLNPAIVSSPFGRKTKKSKPLWRDFSIEGRIRKAYKNRILSGTLKKELLLQTDTPSELEKKSGLDSDPELCGRFHRIYEKARYSEKGCKREDLEYLSGRNNQVTTQHNKRDWRNDNRKADALSLCGACKTAGRYRYKQRYE